MSTKKGKGKPNRRNRPKRTYSQLSLIDAIFAITAAHISVTIENEECAEIDNIVDVDAEIINSEIKKQ